MSASESSAPRTPLLERLALHRPELRAWALYDWANSAFFTVVITAVFPIFFLSVAARDLPEDEKRGVFGWATTASLCVVAFLSPLLGAVADYARLKKKLFAGFLALGVLSTGGLFFVGPGDWHLACWLFGLANIGAAGSFVFYDALLSAVARADELDRLSTNAYALGYLGGGLCLGLCLLLIAKPELLGLVIAPDADPYAKSLPARLGFLVVAAWWALFSIPFFRHVREPDLPLEHDEVAGTNPIVAASVRIAETFRELGRYKQTVLFLVAFLAYNDGIGTIMRMATVIGTQRGISDETMLTSILVIQFVGIPFSVLFGRLAQRFGPKRSILAALVVFVVVCALGYRLSTAAEFVAMAGLVGMVQGGAQALSRSLFASLVPKHKSGEFFGLFSTLEKFSGVLGPLVFSLAPTLGFAIVATNGFFLLGGVLLLFVDVERGRAVAREIDAREVQLAAERDAARALG
ncbi:MAG: MFS transporter [Planctomycetota bacterium]|nr:MFS transporter [Planctomycetota bacterium]